MNPAWHMGLTGLTLVAGGLGIVAMLSDWWSVYYFKSFLMGRIFQYNMGILVEGRLPNLIHPDHGRESVDLIKLTHDRWNPRNVVVLRDAAATFLALGIIVSLYSLFVSCQKTYIQNNIVIHHIYIALLIAAWLAVAVTTFQYLYIHTPLVWRGERLRTVSREWYRLHWSFYFAVGSFCTYLLAIFFECLIIYSIKCCRPNRSRRSYSANPHLDINVTKTRVRCESETHEMSALNPSIGNNSITANAIALPNLLPRQEMSLVTQIDETETRTIVTAPNNPNNRHWN